MKLRNTLSVGLLALLPALYVVAQDDQPGQREQNERRQAAAARDTTSDSASQGLVSHLATILTIKNQEEIELAKFASEKSQNEEVKQFAQMLIKDHTAFIEKLQQFNPNPEYASLDGESASTPTSQRTRRPSNRNPDQPGQEDRDQPNQDRERREQPGQDQGAQDGQDAQGGQGQANRRTQDQQPGQEDPASVSIRRTTVAAGGAQDHQTAHLQVAREAARICLEMTKEKLGQKQGKEFDTCFVGGQVMAHVQMVAKLQAIQQVAPPEFNQVLEEGIQSAQEHMRHAEMLAQKLEGQQQQGGARGENRGGQNERPDATRREDAQKGQDPNQ